MQRCKNCCVRLHACISRPIVFYVGCVQQFRIDFNGEAAFSDALTEADRDLNASEMLAIRMLARGICQDSTAELRQAMAETGEMVPSELLKPQHVLRTLEGIPGGAACQFAMQCSLA